MPLTRVTVTATYHDIEDNPASGRVDFQLSSPILDSDGNEIVARVRLEVALDADGAITVVLPATDEPGASPSGVTYDVVERITGAPVRTFSMVLPYDTPGATIDLADVAPAIDVEMFEYALVGHGHPGYALAADLAAHVDDDADGHDASTISVTPFGTIVATDVQAALEEVAAEAGGAHPDLPAHDALGLATQDELDDAVLAEAIARANADDAHAGAVDPHAGYTTAAELTAAVNAAVDALVSGAPGALDTLNELAAAMGDDPNFAASTATALANTMKATGGGLEVIKTIAASGAAQTLDLAEGNWFDLTLTANCTLTLAGATNGKVCALQILYRQDATGGRTRTLPGSVTWLGLPPTIDPTPGAATVETLFTRNGGATWFGFGDALYPTTAAGDLLLGTAVAGVLSRLAAPAVAGKVMRSNPALPLKVEWEAPPAVHRRFQPLSEYSADAAWTATDSLNAGRLLAVPFHGSVPQAWTHISYVISTAAAGSRYRLGVYRGGGAGYPGALLFDAGLVNGDAPAAAQVAAIPGAPWTNPIDWLWLAVLCEVTGAAARAVATSATLLPMPASTATSTLGLSAWNVAGVAAGALPDPFPAGAGVTIPAHKILLRTAA